MRRLFHVRQQAWARLMRVYTQVDTRLMFEDLFLKLQEFDLWLSTP